MTDYNETYEERARKEKRPVPYEIFKGMGGKHGVLSIELREAYTNGPDKSASGVVFLNMTPTVGKNQYGWDKKVSVALGLADIGKLLLYIRNPHHEIFQNKNPNEYSCMLVHDMGVNKGKARGQDVKYLSLSKPDNMKSFWFNVDSRLDGQTISKVSVPVNDDEILIVLNLLEAAIPAMLSWSPPVKPLN